MVNRNNNKKGFTLVELSLALIFLVIILITIAWLTIHITTIYQKGLAMKAVNATGKELIDDFSRAIGASPAITAESLCSTKYNPEKKKEAYNDCVEDNAYKFIYQQRYGILASKKDMENNTQLIPNLSKNYLPTNGVFCTGRYSYIWNTAYVLSDDYVPYTLPIKIGQTEPAGLKIADSETIKDFRLLKVTDFDRELCAENLDNNDYTYSENVQEYKLKSAPDILQSNIANVNLGEAPKVAIDLLDQSDSDLAIYDMTIFKPTVHNLTSSGFYSGTFILATIRGGINVNATGEFCSDPPDNLNTDFAYCAINKFNFAMRAAGEKVLMER